MPDFSFIFFSNSPTFPIPRFSPHWSVVKYVDSLSPTTSQTRVNLYTALYWKKNYWNKPDVSSLNKL